MNVTRAISHRVLAGVLAAVAIAGATACGGGSSAKNAGGNTVAPDTSGAKALQPTAAAAAPTLASASAGPIVLVATNILFDKHQLSAPAGAVTIDVDNQDAGIPHNLRMFNGTDARAPSLGATAIEAGPVKQSLKLDLAKGQYFYQCDVHPTTMTGTIIVS